MPPLPCIFLFISRHKNHRAKQSQEITQQDRRWKGAGGPGGAGRGHSTSSMTPQSRSGSPLMLVYPHHKNHILWKVQHKGAGGGTWQGGGELWKRTADVRPQAKVELRLRCPPLLPSPQPALGELFWVQQEGLSYV